MSMPFELWSDPVVVGSGILFGREGFKYTLGIGDFDWYLQMIQWVVRYDCAQIWFRRAQKGGST